MNKIIIYYPHKLVFGENSLDQLAEDYLSSGLKRLYLITIPAVNSQISPFVDKLESGGISVQKDVSIEKEPAFNDFLNVLSSCKRFKSDAVAGIGGGSVMDVAKLVAALMHSDQKIDAIVGNGLLTGRRTHLVCVPTTSGTGSEVSPNAILLDEKEGAKKGIISPFLIPDGAYIDPVLTINLPANVTAYTAMDALTHCIEAYTNRHAHPVVDTIALEGISLISHHIKRAFDNGLDPEARSKLALGSVYGGMCLGPVNTAAVHALAYPLGSELGIPHGISNALLLPHVMEFNLNAAVKRFSDIAQAMGIREGINGKENALNGITFIRKLIRECGLPSRLTDIGISPEQIENLAESAVKVQRLLQNNIRKLDLNDIRTIYHLAS